MEVSKLRTTKTSWFRLIPVLIVVVLLIPEPIGLSWGENGHKTVTRLAIDATPEPLRTMLNKYLPELQETSMDPDRRKSEPGTDNESGRHYIDIDFFEAYPFEAFPQELNLAEAKYGSIEINRQGIVPWAIEESFQNLVEAWETNDPNWMRWFGDLAHYVGDLHQPMHTTANFDGQKSGNRGIHALFESVMVDGFWDDSQVTHFRPPDAVWQAVSHFMPTAPGLGSIASFTSAYMTDLMILQDFEPVENPLEEAFLIVVDSYTTLEDLLAAHDKAQEHRQTNPKFYSTFWDEGADKVMERQINKGAYTLARYIMGAWLKAGQPSL